MLTKDKRKIINILSDPKIYYKISGEEYTPGARVHIGYQNYLAYYKDTLIGLLQLDKFSTDTCVIHGCVLPKYCKPIVLKVGGQAVLDLFKNKSEFKKLIATVPVTARHVSRYLKSLGFIEEAKITDCMRYKGKLVDCIFMTYTFNRD